MVKKYAFSKNHTRESIRNFTRSKSIRQPCFSATDNYKSASLKIMNVGVLEALEKKTEKKLHNYHQKLQIFFFFFSYHCRCIKLPTKEKSEKQKFKRKKNTSDLVVIIVLKSNFLNAITQHPNFSKTLE